MPSKFGGVAVSTESRFGGVPVEEPEETSTTKAVLETGAAMGSGLLGTVAGGLTGIAESVAQARHGNFDLSSISENIKKVQNALTYEPRTPEGQQMLQSAGEKIEEAVRLVEAGVAGTGELVAGRGVDRAAETIRDVREKGAGEVVFERTGSPLLATGADIGVDVAALATPIKGGFKAGRTSRPRTAEVVEQAPARTKLTGAEKDLVRTLEKDSFPNKVRPFRSATAKRQQKIDALKEAELTAKQLGDEARPLDVGGSNTRALAQVQGAVSKEGQLLRQEIINRDPRIRDKMIGFLDKTLMKGKSFEGAKTGIINKAKKDSAPKWEEAHNFDIQRVLFQNQEAAAELIGLLQELPLIESIKSAKRLVNTNQTLKPQLKAQSRRMFGPRNTINTEHINMVGLDFLKRGLDRKIFKLKKDPQVQADFIIVKNKLKDLLVKLNPAYGEAVDIWAGRHSALNAINAGRAAFKEIKGNAKSEATLLEEFNQLSTTNKALHRIGSGDYIKSELRRKLDTKTGQTPASVHTAFAGSPAHRELLRTVFESPDDFRRFEQFIQREGIFNDGLKSVNISEAREIALQQAFTLGELPEVLTAAGTDVLFARSGNRFAMLRLIAQAFKEPSQIVSIFRAPETAKIVFARNAQAVIREMIDVLEAQKLVPSMAERTLKVPKKIATAAKLPPEKLLLWLKNEQNRRALAEFGTMVAVAEEANEQLNSGTQ